MCSKIKPAKAINHEGVKRSKQRPTPNARETHKKRFDFDTKSLKHHQPARNCSPDPQQQMFCLKKKKEHSRKFKNTTIHLMICAYVCFGKDIPLGRKSHHITHTHMPVIFLYCRNQPVTRLLPELFVLLKGDSKRIAFSSFTFLLLFVAFLVVHCILRFMSLQWCQSCILF